MTMVILLALLSTSAIAQSVEPPASDRRIQGRVVDASGGAIAAVIRVIRTGNGAAVLRVRADEAGSFRTGQLQAGSYTVTAWAQGFRQRQLSKIAVQGVEVANLGDIQLDFSGCDAPGVMCDFIVEPAPDWMQMIVSSGYFRLKLACGVDFDRKGELHCPETRDSQKGALPQAVDIWFASDGVSLSLVAVNGAMMSVPNSSDAHCRNAKFSEDQFRVDGLGLGADFCVRTQHGSVSHLYLTNDIEKQDTEITLWHVTRKR